MKHTLILALMALAALAAPAGAATTENEIQHLLDFVKDSHVIFIRNGHEYTPAEAASHMARKRDHYKDQIKTAEDFIRLAATRSIVSGTPYAVKTADGKTQPTGDWLMQELARFREKEKSAAPLPAVAAHS